MGNQIVITMAMLPGIVQFQSILFLGFSLVGFCYFIVDYIELKNK